LVLEFDPARALGSNEIFNGISRFEPGRRGRLYAYAVYCRNNVAMSETAWTSARNSTDPRIEGLFRELFMVVWPDSHDEASVAKEAIAAEGEAVPGAIDAHHGRAAAHCEAGGGVHRATNLTNLLILPLAAPPSA
jgi:hypothetical protein